MGIPSYFSNIIRNYPKILENFNNYIKNEIVFHHLFMDCNSIIYDIVNSAIIKSYDEEEFENILIEKVIEKIINYILLIKPKKQVFIAFDGVAPFAKMKQQKTRRYKSKFIEDFLGNKKWNTSKITPGTLFMKKLSTRVSEFFNNNDIKIKMKLKKIITSTSEDPGEGEHKLFQYIRNNNFKKDNVMIYGLDSDLIMLTIFHYHLYNNCYIFREAPDFLNNITGQKYDINDKLVIDISLLRKSILSEMNFNEEQRIYDYVFMCFLLGNDFLPHFPALNIRTHGIYTLLDIYTLVFKKNHNKFLTKQTTSGLKIEWNNFKLLIKELVKREHQYIIEEYYNRDKYDNWNWAENLNTISLDDREKILQNLPIIYRKEEKYICPDENGWEDRYYKSLLNSVSNEIKQGICINYLEGLEWVFLYYSGQCFDWRWSYNYNYPPLFKDLFKYIPNDSKINFINNKRDFYISELQLLYVLPKTQHDLLDKKTFDFVKEYISQNDDINFVWAFCRYFWESHIDFEKIDLDSIEKKYYNFI